MKVRKKKNTIFISIKTFMCRNELVVNGKATPLTPTNVARFLGCSSELIRAILDGRRRSPRYVEKLIKVGFPSYVKDLYSLRQKGEKEC